MSSVELFTDAELRSVTWRAHEARRADRILNDPFASQLVIDTGEQRFGADADGAPSFALAVRTATIDEVLQHAIRDHHIHTVADLGAGLGTRPYRLELPSDLRWIEADRDSILGFKMLRLAHAAPYCQVRRVSADLGDSGGRSAALREIGRDVMRGLVVTEALAARFGHEALDDLIEHMPASFRCWVVDTVAPPGPPRTDHPEPPAMSPADVLAAFERRGWRSKQFLPLTNQAVRLHRGRAAELVATRPPGDLEGVWLFQRAA